MSRLLSLAFGLACVLACASLFAQPTLGVGLPMGDEEGAAVVGAACFVTTSSTRTVCQGDCPVDHGHATVYNYNPSATGRGLSYWSCGCGGSYQATGAGCTQST